MTATADDLAVSLTHNNASRVSYVVNREPDLRSTCTWDELWTSRDIDFSHVCDTNRTEEFLTNSIKTVEKPCNRMRECSEILVKTTNIFLLMNTIVPMQQLREGSSKVAGHGVVRELGYDRQRQPSGHRRLTLRPLDDIDACANAFMIRIWGLLMKTPTFFHVL